MTIPSATLTAPAKINLHLEITGVRDNGYHELSTLFMPLGCIADTLHVSPLGKGEFSLSCPNRPELETEGNLIRKAWDCFGRKTGFWPGVAVTLEKRIPMGAGLGGGSTDCAAILRFLNCHAGEKALPLAELNGLAATLGADVPFFLLDGPARAQGIGDKLTPVELDMAGLHLVVACPDVHVNTAWAYREWDRYNLKKLSPDGLTSENRDTMKPISVSQLRLGNDFESVVFEAFPELRNIKEAFMKSGAAGACMSGSGASVFALFRNIETARRAADKLRAENVLVFDEAC